MTLEERKMNVAYADMLNIEALLDHIVKIGAYEVLPMTRKKDFADAKLLLGDVKGCIHDYVRLHTEYGDEPPKMEIAKDAIIKQGQENKKSPGPCNGHACIHDKESCPRYKMFLDSGGPAIESCNSDMSSCGGASSGCQSPKLGC